MKRAINAIAIKIPETFFYIIRRNYLKIYMETGVPLNNQSNYEPKAMLEVSQYFISNYTVEPQEQNQHNTGTETNTLTNGVA